MRTQMNPVMLTSVAAFTPTFERPGVGFEPKAQRSRFNPGAATPEARLSLPSLDDMEIEASAMLKRGYAAEHIVDNMCRRGVPRGVAMGVLRRVREDRRREHLRGAAIILATATVTAVGLGALIGAFG